MNRTTRLPALPLLLSLALVSLAAGCGAGVLQTARTTPRGDLDVTFSTGFLYNEMVDERGLSPSNLLQGVSFRYGLTDSLDLGARLFFLTGALVDAKLNLLDPRSPFALSVQGGIGGGWDPLGDEDSGALHVPLNLLASYTFASSFTPYLAAGYGCYWIFGREPISHAGVQYADREGHGDGLLQLSLGFKHAVTDGFALLFEYDLYKGLVDDPGDGYSFTDSHMVQMGFAF